MKMNEKWNAFVHKVCEYENETMRMCYENENESAFTHENKNDDVNKFVKYENENNKNVLWKWECICAWVCEYESENNVKCDDVKWNENENAIMHEYGVIWIVYEYAFKNENSEKAMMWWMKNMCVNMIW